MQCSPILTMMKLSQEQVETFVGDFAGKDVIPLVRILKKRKNVSEFKLAERMKLGINQVRNMLYRMNEYNLVSSTRKKDKKKGWYIYYWTFNDREAITLLQYHTQKSLENSRERLAHEDQEQYYLCKVDKLRFSGANAMEYDFRCPECNRLLEAENKPKVLASLKRDITQFEENLIEIGKLQAQLPKIMHEDEEEKPKKGSKKKVLSKKILPKKVLPKKPVKKISKKVLPKKKKSRR